MNTTYAQGTTVTPQRSRDEIEKTLTRYGADSFGFAQETGRAMIAFAAHGRSIRMIFPLPVSDDYARTQTGRVRVESARKEALAQGIREQWRAIALVVKAKLQAVESGVITFEEEFALFTVLPDGSTVGEHVLPAIESAYSTRQVPSIIPRRAIEGGTP